mmetsp:Transcript_20121/g.56024  ORF Transcript_20121/g.56024 Transcript_20121/m.56024 type:complete len:156 (-) Transcript_20121:424-891(-)
MRQWHPLRMTRACTTRPMLVASSSCRPCGCVPWPSTATRAREHKGSGGMHKSSAGERKGSCTRAAGPAVAHSGPQPQQERVCTRDAAAGAHKQLLELASMRAAATKAHKQLSELAGTRAATPTKILVQACEHQGCATAAACMVPGCRQVFKLFVS